MNPIYHTKLINVTGIKSGSRIGATVHAATALLFTLKYVRKQSTQILLWKETLSPYLGHEILPFFGGENGSRLYDCYKEHVAHGRKEKQRLLE